MVLSSNFVAAESYIYSRERYAIQTRSCDPQSAWRQGRCPASLQPARSSPLPNRRHPVRHRNHKIRRYAFPSFPSKPANAKDMALTHEPDKYEGVLLVSGDGLVNEFVNGLMQRFFSDRVLTHSVDCCYAVYNTPICHISAGTQNQIAGGMGTRCFETAAYCIIKVSPRFSSHRSTESKAWTCCACLRMTCRCSTRCAGLSRGSEGIWCAITRSIGRMDACVIRC